MSFFNNIIHILQIIFVTCRRGHKNSKFKVQKIDWKQTDGQTDTTDRIISPALTLSVTTRQGNSIVSAHGLLTAATQRCGSQDGRRLFGRLS